MAPLPILTAYRRAASVFGRNIVIVLFFSVIVGALGAAIGEAVGAAATDAYVGGKPAPQDRSTLVVSLLSTMFLQTFWQGIVGALGAAASIYLWVAYERQQSTSLREAINFALNRAGRMIGPHLKAYAILLWGGQLLVPFILFGLQFAYADAVAALDEKETRALDRSRTLTRPRRAAIFRAFAPFGIWWFGSPLLGQYVLQEQGTLFVALGGAIDHMVNVFIDLVMVQLYIDEVRRRIARAEEKKKAVEVAAAPA